MAEPPKRPETHGPNAIAKAKSQSSGVQLEHATAVITHRAPRRVVTPLMSVPVAEGKGAATTSLLVPHASPAEVVVARLGTDASTGLTAVEASARLAEFGPNRLTRRERPAYLAIALRQAADPLVGLLAAAAIVSGLVGEGLQAAVIGAIVVLNGLLAYVQEAGAEREILALREALSPVASVIRDSRERQVPAGELVQGDVVILREGDRVPADARLVAAPGVQVDESSLTGESVPSEKASDPVPSSAPLAERTRWRSPEQPSHGAALRPS